MNKLDRWAMMLPYRIKETLEDESGMTVIELVLILVVLIGLVVIFRDQLTDLLNNIFKRVVSESNGI